MSICEQVILLLPFWFECVLYLFSCLTALATTSKSGNSCLVPDLRQKAFHFSPLRNANKKHNEVSLHNCHDGHYQKNKTTTKNPKDNKYWKRCGEIGTIVHCWWECKVMQPLGKTVWRFPKKFKNRTII